MASPGHTCTATTAPFDFGIDDILDNSFEDDGAFWDEFGKYEDDDSRTDLTKNLATRFP